MQIPASVFSRVSATTVLFMLFTASVGVAGYALVAYSIRPVGTLVHPAMQAVYELHRPAIYTHIFASALTLLLGPLQFMPILRARWPRLHRITGRIYLGIGVLFGGLAALYMAQYAYGGLVSRAGFTLLSLVWLYTGVRAFLSIRQRDIAAHRRWMIRNYALALAAVTLRIGLGIGFGLRMDFDIFYPALAWVSWVPNLLVAECLIRATRR